MLTSRHLMNAIAAFVITVNLQSLAYPQEESGTTLIMPRYSPWKLSPLGHIGTNQNCLALEVDGEVFLVRNNSVNRIAIFVDGKRTGYAVRGTRVSPVSLFLTTAARPSEVPPENDRLISCAFHLIGAGKIDYITVNETTNRDQPVAPNKE